MRNLATFGMLLALASPAVAQRPAPHLTSRSISIPSEIAPAIVPYVLCLSSEMNKLPEVVWNGRDVYPAADLVKRRCAQERDDAIFLSATTLEQLNRTSIEWRKSLIFDTLAAVEDNAFLAPTLPGSPRR